MGLNQAHIGLALVAPRGLPESGSASVKGDTAMA